MVFALNHHKSSQIYFCVLRKTEVVTILRFLKSYMRVTDKVELAQTCYSRPSCSKRCQLNKLVKGHFVNCFIRFNTQYSDIFC